MTTPIPIADSPTLTTDGSTLASNWRPQLPRRDRTHPRAFGVGKFGTDRFDSRDDTRYAWARIAPAITAALLAVFTLTAPARASNQYCESADAITATYGFCKPSVDVEGANPWGTKYNTNLDMIDAISSSGTFTVLGGEAGQLVYGTAHNQSGWLGAGAQYQIIQMISGFPAWTSTPTLSSATVLTTLAAANIDVNRSGLTAHIGVLATDNTGISILAGNGNIGLACADNWTGTGGGCANLYSFSSNTPVVKVQTMGGYYGLFLLSTTDYAGTNAGNISNIPLVVNCGFGTCQYNQGGLDSATLTHSISYPVIYDTFHVTSLGGFDRTGPLHRFQEQMAGVSGAYFDVVDWNNVVIATMTHAGNFQTKFGIVAATMTVSGTTISGTGYLSLANALGIQASTLATIVSLAPTNLGDTRYCTTCSPPKIVVATGTSTGNWADAAGGAFK